MPRTNLDAWKGKLSTNLWNHLARVRGAHLNSMEVFPLFAAAVVSPRSHLFSSCQANKTNPDSWKCCQVASRRHEFDVSLFLCGKNVIPGCVHGNQTQHAGIREDWRMGVEHFHPDHVSLESRTVDGTGLEISEPGGLDAEYLSSEHFVSIGNIQSLVPVRGSASHTESVGPGVVSRSRCKSSLFF